MRDPEQMKKEERNMGEDFHIDLSKESEIWHHEDLKDAYKRIFSKFVIEYNDAQSRKDRIIEDYFKSVKKHKTKKLFYEAIITIGNEKGHPEVSDETRKEIYKEYYLSFKARNPHLEIIGVYYHADEQGIPHIHINYIPVAKNYMRGMKTQNGIERALNQQGFKSKSIKETAQMSWQKK